MLCLNFNRRVTLACGAIPRGYIASYGLIARLCGAPRHARHVGRALANGASDVAYRVVNHRGELTGADAFLVPGLQQSLLEEDGIEVSKEARVNMRLFAWQPTEADIAALDREFMMQGI